MWILGIKGWFLYMWILCTFDLVIPEIKKLVAQRADVTPILSDAAYHWDTRFYPLRSLGLS